MLEAKDLEQYVMEEASDWRGNDQAQIDGHWSHKRKVA